MAFLGSGTTKGNLIDGMTSEGQLSYEYTYIRGAPDAVKPVSLETSALRTVTCKRNRETKQLTHAHTSSLYIRRQLRSRSLNMSGKTRTMAAAALVVMVVVIALLNVGGAAADPIETRRAPSPPQTLALPSEASQHQRTKRSYVDTSCKGLYSRMVWDELYYVCEDCDNVFRQDGFQAECRRGCFASDIFAECLSVLSKDVDLYQTMATSLRGS